MNSGTVRFEKLRNVLRISVCFLTVIVSGFCSPVLAVECVVSEHSIAPQFRSAHTPAGMGLLGVSTRYDIDDDSFWSSSLSVSALRASRISTMRYPGGEVSDNYDWEAHRLERPNDFPRDAATAEERALRTDFREFLVAADKAGVRDLFFVVNVDGAVRAPGRLNENIEKYAEKAARWVKVVNASGTKVKYWEVGNEVANGSYPLKVEEYAAILRAYAKAMRAVDPNIKIGASGLLSVKAAGRANRVGRDRLLDMRSGRIDSKKPCGDMSMADCMHILTEEAREEGVSRAAAWWPQLVKLAGDSFDFVVIHSYERVVWPKGNGGAIDFPRTEKLKTLKSWLAAATGRDIQVAMTEWNTPNQVKEGRITEMDHLMDISVQIGNAAVGGVDFAHYWPLRNRSDNSEGGNSFRSFFTRDASASPAAQLFGVIGQELSHAQVSEAIVGVDLYALRIQSSAGRNAMLIVNRGTSAVGVRFPDFQGNPKVRVDRLFENVAGRVSLESCATSALQERRGLLVPGKSVSVFRTDH